SHRQRHTNFDTTLFSLYSNGSPSQAKRALEAHIAETDRRLQEASSLGSVLLQQKEELNSRLQDVKAQEQQDEIAPELKSKLVELEREVNEVSRETARSFLTQKRSTSGDGQESSVFMSDANHSPSKVHAPSRKQRNQQPSRVNDLKLATDISTSLLSQVRDLQAVIAEKDDDLKAAKSHESQLEVDFELLRQRFRATNESEQRFKDENWALETQIHELQAAQQQNLDKEQKLNHTLKIANLEKSNLERDFEELKAAHGKLSEDHTTTRKHHEAEIGTLKRSAAADEAERTALQKKVDELTNNNHELARAVSYKMDQSRNSSAEHIDGEHITDDQRTPDDSPPGSPSKATPRHGHLQNETLQTSMAHATRTLQNYKNQIHREKTEKFELRKLLQEARDELEKLRGGFDSGKKRKSGKDQDLLFKKPARPDRLGAHRQEKDEIIIDDEEWEEHDGQDTPSKPRVAAFRGRSENREALVDATTDNYMTATEHSEAFMTANERETSAVETDAFHTGAETLDGNSSDELTEREDGPSSALTTIAKRPSPKPSRRSFQSTASTSGDDDEYEARTPVQTQAGKFRFKVNRAASRRISGPPSPTDYKDSPSSIASSSPATGLGQSLAAELENMSDDGTEEGTPRSMKALSPHDSPELVKKSPAPSKLRASFSSEEKPAMVDTGVMTEPWEPEIISKHDDVDHEKELANIAVPQLAMAPMISQEVEPLDPPSPISVVTSLQASPVVSQHVQPVEVGKPVPSLSHSAVFTQHTEPVEHAVAPVVLPTLQEQKAAPSLGFSRIFSEVIEPVEAPRPSTAVKVESAAASTPIADRSVTSQAAKSGGMGLLGSMLRRNKSAGETTVAEDETSSSPKTVIKQEPVTPTSVVDTRIPFRPVDGNAPPSPERRPAKVASTPKPLTLHNESTQTMLSSKEIDRILKGKAEAASDPFGRPPRPTGEASFGPVLPGLNPRRPSSRDSVNTAERVPRRPGSSGSMRSRASTPPPPLPTEAKQVIAAAAKDNTGAAAAPQTRSMGPPMLPASAYNKNRESFRPRTPVNGMPSPGTRDRSVRGTPSRSGAISPATTRRSSVSSFASELDQRFNIRSSQMSNPGFDANNTDPRMIQAITQTMIGEYLHKYTRKAGREEMSDSRHQRFFWVHPYTRTLYWSNQDPAAGRTELKAKSVAIEAVRVVADDNPMPPGLHRKSLVVITPGRTIKFTAPTSQRHETWFNALSYLLLRTPNEGEDADMTAEDVEEFNPGFFRNTSRMTRGSRASMSSYTSRVTQRNISPSRPTITASRVSSHQAPSVGSQPQQPAGSLSGRLSALSGVFKSTASMSSRHSKQMDASSYDDTAHQHDSMDDLRKELERQEKHSDRLENVRACCDGKHDVGSLSRSGRHISHTHSHSH
ncbi:hypothetical protein EJ08DRAFT_557906, partial [Tothia fuscella]